MDPFYPAGGQGRGKAAVGMEDRSPVPVGEDLQLLPRKTAQAGAEGFEQGLLGGETAGQTEQISTAEPAFGRGEKPGEETLPGACHCLPEPGDGYQVEADSYNQAPSLPKRRDRFCSTGPTFR